MIDWSDCPHVTRRVGYIGGKPALREDPRVPPEVICENMDDGMTAEEIVDSFSLRTPIADVLAVYAYAKAHVAHPA
jgi:uncharacterized protein (DUF433 family)